jgi:hypothetical protein
MKKRVVLSQNLVDLPYNHFKGNVKPLVCCKSIEPRTNVDSDVDGSSVRSNSLMLSPNREQGRFNVSVDL